MLDYLHVLAVARRLPGIVSRLCPNSSMVQDCLTVNAQLVLLANPLVSLPVERQAVGTERTSIIILMNTLLEELSKRLIDAKIVSPEELVECERDIDYSI